MQSHGLDTWGASGLSAGLQGHMPPPPWLALERMNQDHRGSSAGSWLHALEKVTNCCPLGVAGGSAKEQRGCGGGGGSHQTLWEGLGTCKGTPLLTFPTACPPRDAFTELPEGLKKKKKKGRGRKVTREQT